MVCEIPRTRQLLLRKKGSFFEDPFFRDVWDDYNHAVRRIVDRFNRGWVSPSDRLRDSQYHSMYRTLRSARLNYSTHSARFKEEGNVYKLVMDVREFLGGDITVRTAGGTVSVRGKMEMNADEESKKTIRDDSDDGSTVSGKSTSAKTLHRRFTLPADADCEKIESSLSRDAVLTVTIPKRSDIHYIPVNIEGEDNNKENESLSVARGSKDSARQPGVKRPSDTASEPNRKKSQDESVTYRRKYKQENSKGEDDKEERRSRRRSKDYDYDDKSKLKLDKEKENTTKDEINGKRIKRNSDLNDSPNSGFRRREKSIYEEVQEINIPVRIDKNEPSDKIFRPSSVHEPVIHNIEIQRDSTDSNQESDIEMEKETSLYKDRKHNESPVKVDLSTRPKYSVLENSVDPLIKPLKLNVRRKNENCEDEKKTKSQLFRGSSNPCHRDSSKEREDDKTDNKLSLNKILYQVNGVSETKTPSTIDHNGIIDKRHSIPSIDIKTYGLLNEQEDKTESENKDIGKNYFGKMDSNKKLLSNISSEHTRPETEEKEPKLKSKLDVGEVNGFNCKLKDKLETPISSLVDRPASPISPGSRIVKVEEDSSLMEEGMFKDCWSDFSNTLQDVLSRLQELSSELSQSKILAATTPSAESSPPVTEKGWADEAHSKNEPEASLDLLPKDNLSLNKGTFAHRTKIDVGGVGESEGGAKDDNRSAHFPWRSGHGRNETRNLGADGQSDSHKDTTQATQKLPCLPNDLPSVNSLDDKINKSFKSERPFSLPLRNVASPQGKFVSQEQGEESSSPPASRPNSIFLTDATPGSLLESLRKNSPVESLQEDFLRRTCLSESSERKANYVPVEVDKQRAVPVGGQRKEEERSVSLSPSDSQSNVELVGSESESGTSCALENTQDSHNSKACAPYKIYGDSDKSALTNEQKESPFKNKSLLNDLSTSNPTLQQVSKDDSIRNLVFEPNIDTSPESNLTDESECSSPEEGIVRGTFSFPAVSSKVSEREVTRGLAQREDYKAFSSLADVIGSSDVTESTTCANENLPKIPSDDEMVCERPLPPSPRGPRRDAKQEPLRFSRINRPRDLLLQEVRGDVEGSREPNGEMGGVLSKGRKTPSRVYSEALSESPTTKSPSAYSSSPSSKATKQPLPPEEPSIPPYVRLRSEPTKRYSGFAHVNSDNVRRMRDVWGPKPETVPPHLPQTPPRSSKVPPSPTKTSSRRLSDATERSSPARTQRSESPRVGSYPSSEKSSYPFNRSSPSPDRGYSSPSYQKYSKNKVCKESPPPSPKYTNSSSKPSTPSYSSYTRKGSQVGQDRSSPVPSSPCRRCSRGAKESPSPSPSVESRKKFNYETRVREENPRSKPSASTSSSRKEYTDSKPQPKKEAPTASKVHQKIFRRLRDANLQPDSEAICFKEEPDKYKMVLDVEEYVPGEVEVLQDDLVLTVKGRVERRDPGGHVSVKTFDRKFNIPKNSREEEIDSALSNDGILTIYVPKKRERVIKIELVD